jgi:hypothetical protein
MKFRALHLTLAVLGLSLAGLIAHNTTSLSGTHLHGTSIFHRYLKLEMTFVGAEEDPVASGKIQIKHNQQGKSDRQQMFVKVDNLTEDADYYLLAWLGDDTEPVTLSSFQSSGDGKGKVKFKRKLQGKGNSKFDLPNLKDPVDDIRKLAVADDEMNVVLEADLTMPDQFHYLVKRELTNDGNAPDAEGVIHLKGNHKQVWFRLRVGGLDADTAYTLALNDEAMDSITTDENGTFDATTALDIPLDVFMIDDISILNGDDESVLSTNLP